jgi:cobalamin synthase
MDITDLINSRDRIRRELSDKICGTFAALLGIAVLLASIVLLPWGMNNVPPAFGLVAVVLGIVYWIRHLIGLHNDIAKINDQVRYFHQASQSVTIMPH